MHWKWMIEYAFIFIQISTLLSDVLTGWWVSSESKAWRSGKCWSIESESLISTVSRSLSHTFTMLDRGRRTFDYILTQLTSLNNANIMFQSSSEARSTPYLQILCQRWSSNKRQKANDRPSRRNGLSEASGGSPPFKISSPTSTFAQTNCHSVQTAHHSIKTR
jgi:hypothetical protein